MNEFIIRKNNFLKKDIKGYYHTDYLGWQCPGNPDYLNIFKLLCFYLTFYLGL